MSNLDLWEKVRNVPETAIKQINGGRLKGMSDINPAWRLKTLTEQFGPCGIGWKYVITEKRLETGANEEISAFVDIDLFIKHDGEWSEAIPGTGGSSFIAKERNGLYTSDECFKMALTDAISVACKALGFGADIYWNKDETKYSKASQEGNKAPSQPQSNKVNTNIPPAPIRAPKEDIDPDNLFCVDCEKQIDQKVYNYSMDKLKKPLCFNCQKAQKG